jgi:hypothetical protein
MPNAVNPGAGSANNLAATQYVELFNVVIPANTSTQSPLIIGMAVLTLGGDNYPINFIVTIDPPL